VVAVVSRLVLTLADLIWAAAAGAIGRHHPAAASQDSAASPAGKSSPSHNSTPADNSVPG
jgi:hypothetical protein